MAVYAYVGRPGAGKSYGVVENSILPACRSGRHVVTNVPLRVDRIMAEIPQADVRVVATEWFDSDVNLNSVPGGTLIVIDEAWRVFPAGQKLNSVSRDRAAFFAQHRHKVGENGLTQDIVLIVQDLSKIAAWARTDVDKTFVATKLDAAGMDRKFRVDIYQGAVKGPKYPDPDLGFSIHEYKDEVYRFYVSHTMGSGVPGMEIKPDKRATVFNHPLLKWGMPVSAVFGVVALYYVVGFFSGRSAESAGPSPSFASSNPSTAPADPPPSPPPSPSPSPSPSGVPYSESWRFIGVAAMGDGRMFAVIESPNGRRRISADVCIDIDFEPVCTVDGERVARFTGVRPHEASSVGDIIPVGLVR